MDVVGKLLDKVISPLRGWGIFQVFASLVAVLALAVHCDQGIVFPSDTISTEAFLALQGTPLAALYRLLGFFSIPAGWIEAVAAYIAANAQRAQAIGVFAALLGVAVSFVLVPDANRNPLPAPSVQASTWWVAYAITMQTDINEGFSTNNSLFMVVFLVLLWGFREVRSRVFNKGMNLRFALDFVQLFVAVLYLIAMFFPIIFSGHPNYRRDCRA